MRRNRSIALCHSDLKQSALYFDMVVPSSKNIIDEIAFLHDRQDISGELLLQALIGDEYILDRQDYLSKNDHAYIFTAIATSLIKTMHDTIVRKLFTDTIHSIGESTVNLNYEPEYSPSLLLSSMPLVDVKDLPWQHIIELRKDSGAMDSLKDLRNMIFIEYKDKPFSYIEDQIFKRIESYENTVRKWGMETVESSVELILSHKNSAALAGFSSTIFGAPISSAILLGASATLANVGFHIRKRRREKQQFMNLDPIRYIYKVKRLKEIL